MNKEISEQVIEQGLLAKEQGRNESEILDMFPEWRQELTEIFQTISVIENQKEGVVPSQERFRQLIIQLARLANTNGVQQENNLEIEKQNKGRVLITNFSHSIDQFMNFNWKIAAPLGIVAALVLVFIFSQTGTRTPEGGAPVITSTPIELPPATGNIDDTLQAFLILTENENAAAQEGNDSDLISFDDQELGGFDQSF